MSKSRSPLGQGRKPYKAFLRGSPEENNLEVGARSVDSDYVGPYASITFDKSWLTICTDEYEGNAMLNIETLPVLRRALGKIARHIKSQTSEASGSK